MPNSPPPCQISPPSVQRVAPQNRPLSKLNTGRFALHAMLPVKKNGHPALCSLVGRCYGVILLGDDTVTSGHVWVMLVWKWRYFRARRSKLSVSLSALHEFSSD